MKPEENSVQNLIDSVRYEIAKSESNQFDEVLSRSLEREALYEKKILEVNPLIIELKELKPELDELLEKGMELAQLAAKNPDVKEMKDAAIDVLTEYSEKVGKILEKAYITFSTLVDQDIFKQKLDHVELLKILKKVRSEFRSLVIKEKSNREKIISTIAAETSADLDLSPLGKRLSENLIDELKTYPASMQQVLKKYKWDKTEKVLVLLKELVLLHGYQRTEITPDFVRDELVKIQEDVKESLKEYKEISEKVKDASEMNIASAKIEVLKQSELELKDKVEQLEEEKSKIEKKLSKEKKMFIENNTSVNLVDELKAASQELSEKVAELIKEETSILQKEEVSEEEKTRLIEIENELEEISPRLLKIEQGIEELENIGIKSEKQDSLEENERGIKRNLEEIGYEDEDIEQPSAKVLKLNEVDEEIGEETIELRKDEEDEEYVPLTEQEKEKLSNELTDITERLEGLGVTLERVSKAIEQNEKAAEDFELLEEREEDVVTKLEMAVKKLGTLKDLNDAIEKRQNPSYEHLYI